MLKFEKELFDFAQNENVLLFRPCVVPNLFDLEQKWNNIDTFFFTLLVSDLYL